MAPMPSLEKTFTCALSNLTNVYTSQEHHYLSQNISRKFRSRLAFKLNKKMYTTKTIYEPNIWKEQMNIYPASVSPYSKSVFPLATDFNQIQPLITVPSIPIFIPTASPMLAPICPYVGTVLQPTIPIVPQTLAQDEVFIYNYVYEYYCRLFEKASHLSDTQYGLKDLSNFVNSNVIISEDVEETDELEMYLKLPKDLFPTARMITADPNPIVNEFCKLDFIENHTPWLLDLEFGTPKAAISRPVPIYDVKFNSIHCKNTPSAIHPGFESCDADFQTKLLFYYDSIISSWYKGYVMFYGDISVDNFQAWLLIPMQALGMSWH